MQEPGVKTPTTLLEATRYFGDKENAFQFIKKLRWPDGVRCPFCKGEKHSFVKTRQLWQCKECNKQFSVKKGTIFEDSPIKLDVWLVAMWLIGNAKNGICSMELHRSLGVTQKTAWFMLHRIRLAMQTGSLEKLSGPVEVDETFIGGKETNKHRGKRKGIKSLGPIQGKTVVVGMLERDGEIRTKVIRNARRVTLYPEIEKNVEPGATVYTDSLRSYHTLGQTYEHGVVDHKVEFVNGEAHTNGLENFWRLLKRTMSGTYVSVEPVHLFRYLDQYTFRFNQRKRDDASRLENLVASIAGKRLTYDGLTGRC